MCLIAFGYFYECPGYPGNAPAEWDTLEEVGIDVYIRDRGEREYELYGCSARDLGDLECDCDAVRLAPIRRQSGKNWERYCQRHEKRRLRHELILKAWRGKDDGRLMVKFPDTEIRTRLADINPKYLERPSEHLVYRNEEPPPDPANAKGFEDLADDSFEALRLVFRHKGLDISQRGLMYDTRVQAIEDMLYQLGFTVCRHVGIMLLIFWEAQKIDQRASESRVFNYWFRRYGYQGVDALKALPRRHSERVRLEARLRNNEEAVNDGLRDDHVDVREDQHPSEDEYHSLLQQQPCPSRRASRSLLSRWGKR